MNGKLIVIAGIDGSGKSVQTDLLVKRLTMEGYRPEKIDFPQYGKTFFSDMIARYLRGEFGDVVNPFLASLSYAGDRWECKGKIFEWLKEGRIIISDRYACCNKAHQGAKIEDKTERRAFFDWIDALEHQVYNIPRPDLTILLYVDVKIASELIDKRIQEFQGSKFKVQGSGSTTNREPLTSSTLNPEPLQPLIKDIHESNTAYLRRVQEIYLELACMEKDWERIDCVEDGRLLTKERIALKVWDVVKNILN